MYTAQATEYLSIPRTANTIRAYASDWQDFADWCKQHNLSSLPATADTVGNYISELADVVCANTVARHLTAIGNQHVIAGYGQSNPAKSWEVRRIMSNIKRTHGTHQCGKAAITPDILRQMLPHFDTSLQSIRDKAIILIGFGAALRRSEIVSLQMQDVQITANGAIITITHSKTDPYGTGQIVAIPRATDTNICPVRALTDWLIAANIKSGYIFRPLWRGQHIKDDKLCDKAVALIIKHYCDKIGLDSTQYSGHSLRRGFATSAARADVTTLDIMRQTRHKSETMVNRYIAEGRIFANHPLSKIL